MPGASEEQLAALVLKYQGPLLGYARRRVEPRDAEEIVNDAFCVAGKRANLARHEDEVRSFLYTITRNLCLDRLRRKQLETIPFSDETVPLRCSATDESTRGDTPQIRAVKAALLRLPKRTQTLFEMRFSMGMTLKEIGEVLQIKEGTVASMMHRLKASIEKTLRNC